MSPCALIFTPATCSPAATTALTALVTSCCRNVDAARAMASTGKAAYRSLEIVQAAAQRPEHGPAIRRALAKRPPRSLLRPAAQVIKAGRAIGPAGDEPPEHLRSRDATAPAHRAGTRLARDFGVTSVTSV